MTFKKPVWISHRGAADCAAENTSRAFEIAQQKGFHAFETDLRLTADRQIVLCHDLSLRRVFGLRKQVQELTKNELSQVQTTNGDRPMFFEEILMNFLKYRWTFEFKPESAEGCIRRFLEIVASERLQDWVHSNVKFLVYDTAHFDQIRKELPQAKFYALFRDCKKIALSLAFRLPFWKEISPDLTYGLPPTFMGIDFFQKKFVETFHRADANILAYLPRTDAQAHAAVAAGFDEILTDFQPLV